MGAERWIMMVGFLSLLLCYFQGEHFGTTEATEAFFAMTRLFQSNDVSAKFLPLAASLLLSEFAGITQRLGIGMWEANTSENKLCKVLAEGNLWFGNK